PRGRRAALARRAAAAPPVRPGRPSRLPIARAPTGSATAIHHAISRHGRACPPHGRPGPAASGCFPCPSRYVHRDAGRNDHVRRPPRALTRPRRRPILSTVSRGPSRHPCEAPVKILCTGDVHIGRSSTRFRGDPDARALSCAGAWSLIVDRAIAERVDLVAVSGDLVDRANRSFEAYGPLERGLERLKEAGIRTVAVAGNHDFDVLPGLVTTIGDAYFRLLGADGRWERLTLSRDGATIHLDGWSFPREHHPGNPLTGYDLPDPGGAAVLGLLHCDVDQTASRYAPVALAELRRV